MMHIVAFLQLHFLHIFFLDLLYKIARCLKIIEKVLFNIASEASYVYILGGQNAKNV